MVEMHITVHNAGLHARTRDRATKVIADAAAVANI
jgi:hypothetical protein